MAKRKFPSLRNSSWERGYRPGMASVKGDDGFVTHYNPKALDALTTTDHTSRDQWTIKKKLVERRKREGRGMQSA